MDKIIDINNVESYPTELIELFKEDNKQIDFENLLKNYYFKCAHICCTDNIDNYKKHGIMRPYQVNKDGSTRINDNLKNIILLPLKNYTDYNLYFSKYDEVLENTYKKDKDLIDDWYGKYSCVCYTLDSINKINANNPAYEPIINLYGGEVLRDIGVPEKIVEELGSKYKTYIIFFKLSYHEVAKKCIYPPDIIEHMRIKYDNRKSNYEFENNVNKDIHPDDFIEIYEVNKHE